MLNLNSNKKSLSIFASVESEAISRIDHTINILCAKSVKCVILHDYNNKKLCHIICDGLILMHVFF